MSGLNALSKVWEILAEPFAEFDLPDRDADMIRLHSRGYTYDEIGEAMKMNPKTVSVHLHKIRKKVGMMKGESTRYVFNQIEKEVSAALEEVWPAVE